MDVVEFFIDGWIWRCSGKDYVEAFNFRVQITKEMKSFKEFQETTRHLVLLLLMQSRGAENGRSFDDELNL